MQSKANFSIKLTINISRSCIFVKKGQFSLILSFLLEYYNVQSSDKHLKTFQQTIEVGDIAMLCENNE